MKSEINLKLLQLIIEAKRTDEALVKLSANIEEDIKRVRALRHKADKIFRELDQGS